MLNLNPEYRCFYVEGITDMRLGHFRLCNTIREMLGRDPYNGDVFITMSRKRDKGRGKETEREIRNLNMTPEQIKERRNREDVKTIMRELYEKAQDLLDNPEEHHYSELMKKALKYMLNGWDGLQKYIEDGNYDIDNCKHPIRHIYPNGCLHSYWAFYGSFLPSDKFVCSVSSDYAIFVT